VHRGLILHARLRTAIKTRTTHNVSECYTEVSQHDQQHNLNLIIRENNELSCIYYIKWINDWMKLFEKRCMPVIIL